MAICYGSNPTQEEVDMSDCDVGKPRFERLLSGTSTQAPDDSVQNNDELVEVAMSDLKSELTPRDLQSTLSRLAAEEVLLEDLERHLHFQSELGRWAHEAVRAQEIYDAICDGPALTADGIALDAGSGSAIFFSHSRELASSYAWKEEAKERARMLSAEVFAQRIRQLEAQIDSGEACTIDSQGVVRGAKVLADMHGPSSSSQQKLFHQKRNNRRQKEALSTFSSDDVVLFSNSLGMVEMYLQLPSSSPKHAQKMLLRRAQRESLLMGCNPGEAIVIDTYGIIHLPFDD